MGQMEKWVNIGVRIGVSALHRALTPILRVLCTCHYHKRVVYFPGVQDKYRDSYLYIWRAIKARKKQERKE